MYMREYMRAQDIKQRRREYMREYNRTVFGSKPRITFDSDEQRAARKKR